MLSISPIRCGDQADYYSRLGEAERHDYYSEDGDRAGKWWGHGAESLGLVGDVDPESFKNILEGLSPEGTRQLVQTRTGRKLKRRAGFDLTASVPKSFSVAWSQGDQITRDKLDALAERALYKMLEVVDETCGVTRRGKDGHITERARLVGAIFKHDTARGIPGEAPDCNLHFHCVLANIVVREDGTTGALDARPFFQRRAKMALGAMFRAELSKLIETELGLVTHRPVKEGAKAPVSWFELECVPKAAIEAFSKRRREIDKWLRKHGLSGAIASEQAALRTRQTKEPISASELFRAWRKEGRSLGFSWDELKTVLREARPRRFNTAQESENAIRSGLRHIEEHNATFTEFELLERVAIESQTRGVGVDEIRTGVETLLRSSDEIVRLRGIKPHEVRFTTTRMLALERELITKADRLNSESNHAVSFGNVNSVLCDHSTASPEQREAVRYVTTGSDISLFCGLAGTGKTWTLGVVREVLERQGRNVIGTTLSAKASRGLEDGSGIRSLHVHKLFQAIERSEVSLNSQSVIIVDEAGMLGTKHTHKILELVESAQAKVILVGDHKQLQAVDAGSPFRKLGERIGASQLSKIIRQKDEWMRSAIRELRDGDAYKALESFHEHGQLVIAADRDEAIGLLVAKWKRLVMEQGELLSDTLALAGTNLEVRELNKRIQQEIRDAGWLGDHAVEVDGLDIHLGDRVIFTRNNRLLEIQNGAMGEVIGARDKTLWVMLDGSGLEVEIDTEQFSHLTLGFAVGVYKAQGMTASNALVLTGDSMTDREVSYVAVSRSRKGTWIYTDEFSTEALPELAELVSRSRQKEMATDYVQEPA